MTATGGAEYRLDRLRKVDEQLQALALKADSLGMHEAFFQALKTVIEHLRTRPLDWGDPERKTRKQGGIVCHGILDPLFVKYVVYETERAVCILQINALPRTPFA